ncbi:hypothetical protein Nmel_005773 [Mimus melanotis]
MRGNFLSLLLPLPWSQAPFLLLICTFFLRERQTDGEWQPLIFGVILDSPCNLLRFVNQ